MTKNKKEESHKPISWEEFENEIKKEQQITEELKLEKPHAKIFPPLYRGQAKASDPLKTTLERYYSAYIKQLSWDGTGDVKWTMEEQLSWGRYNEILVKVHPSILSLTSHKFNLEDFPNTFRFGVRDAPPNYDLMIYLRHHGFPSPLLDWTISPYIAAFFAFEKAGKEENVAIFSFREPKDIETYQMNEPHIIRLGPYTETHKRHFQQRCEYTICFKETLEKNRFYCPYDGVKSGGKLKPYIIPSKERKKVMAKLDLMNINAYTLFGSEESLVSTLASREIEI